MIEWYWIIAIMVFAHIIEDFHIQGILAKMKQRDWWHDQFAEMSYKLQLMPRSSLGYKYGFRLANTVGVIDKDYIEHPISAKIMVDTPLSLKKGERFMQGVFIPVAYDLFEDIPTATRDGGHGSTGE